jgi:hypothetical protein
MKYLILTLFMVILNPQTSLAETETPDISLTGTLKQGTTEEGESYLFIEVPQAISATTDSGEVVQSSQLQLAGLSPEAWKQAFDLLDKPVIIAGRPMPAMTRYHHTAVLWLCERVLPDKK